MADKIINMQKLHEELNLSIKQKELIVGALEKVMSKYSLAHQHEQNINFANFISEDYFAGVIDGLNHAFKIINNIDDDYNFTE